MKVSSGMQLFRISGYFPPKEGKATDKIFIRLIYAKGFEDAIKIFESYYPGIKTDMALLEADDILFEENGSSDTDEELLQSLMEANEVLRSAYAVAIREGKDTYWQAFQNRLKYVIDAEKKVLVKYTIGAFREDEYKSKL